MKKIKTISKINVEFYDLDPMNVVWHGNYVKYIEKARCDFLEKIGYTYDNMREENVIYPVATIELKFIKSATFKQELIIETTLETLEPALVLKYTIFDSSTKEILCKVKTMQICVDTKTKESLYQAPVNFVKKIEEFKQ